MLKVKFYNQGEPGWLSPHIAKYTFKSKFKSKVDTSSFDECLIDNTVGMRNLLFMPNSDP